MEYQGLYGSDAIKRGTGVYSMTTRRLYDILWLATLVCRVLPATKDLHCHLEICLFSSSIVRQWQANCLTILLRNGSTKLNRTKCYMHSVLWWIKYVYKVSWEFAFKGSLTPVQLLYVGQHWPTQSQHIAKTICLMSTLLPPLCPGQFSDFSAVTLWMTITQPCKHCIQMKLSFFLDW